MTTIEEKNKVLKEGLVEINRIVPRALADTWMTSAPATEIHDRLTKALRDVAKQLADVTRQNVLGEPKAAPVDAPLEGFRKFLTFDRLGIEFKRFKSKDSTKFVAQWRDELNSHVYEITVLRGTTGWIALAQNDGHHVFDLNTRSRTRAEQCAVSAMKRYLARGHRQRLRTLRAAENKEPTDEKAQADMQQVPEVAR